MIDGIDRGGGYYREYFNLGCILRGEVGYLEDIKRYIIEEYIEAGTAKMIKPTYSKAPLSLVNEEKWKTHRYRKKEKTGRISLKDKDFYFACILRGEVEHLEEIKRHIQERVEKELVTVIEVTYSKEKIFIVEDSGEN